MQIAPIGECNEIGKCEVCGNPTLARVLDLGLHPMCDDLVRIGDPHLCAEYPIDILYCETCRTGHQRFQVPKRTLFPESYHYRSHFTLDVLSGMKSLVASCEQRFGSLAGKKVIDIGCNDGSLLDFFFEKKAVTIGVEPTSAAQECAKKGHVTIHDFFTEKVADEIAARHGKPDFISFTNVFAHIEDLEGVVAALKRLITTNTVLIIENHYLGSILQGNQFDTFYHEHPRTYSYRSFVYIARALGMNLLDVEFPSRYGGNIRIFAGMNRPMADQSRLGALEEAEAGFGDAFSKLNKNMVRWRERKGELLRDMVRRHGPLRGKAFPGRAAILIKLLGLGEDSIFVVHEKPGSMKIGHYLPGTRIPIRSDDELFVAPLTKNPLLNLAWHIPGEIRGYLKEHDYRGAVIDILEHDDFQSGSGQSL